MNALFNLVLASLNEGREKVAEGISKYRNKAFLEAAIASVIVIGMSDGMVTPDEKDRLFAYVKQADELSAFSSDDVIAIYRDIIKYYEFDARMGDAEALKIIGRLKGDEEQSVFVVRAACAIAMRNGTLKDKEKAAVHMICTELGIPLDKIQL